MSRRSIALPVFIALAAMLFALPVRAASVFSLGDDAGVVGELVQITSRYEDTLVDIGRLHKLGFEELRLANPDVDPWLPGEGTEVALPSAFVLPRSARSGVVINIAEYRLYFYYELEWRNLRCDSAGEHRAHGLGHAAGAHAHRGACQEPELVSAAVGARGIRRRRAGAAPSGAPRA